MKDLFDDIYKINDEGDLSSKFMDVFITKDIYNVIINYMSDKYFMRRKLFAIKKTGDNLYTVYHNQLQIMNINYDNGLTVEFMCHDIIPLNFAVTVTEGIKDISIREIILHTRGTYTNLTFGANYISDMKHRCEHRSITKDIVDRAIFRCNVVKDERIINSTTILPVYKHTFNSCEFESVDVFVEFCKKFMLIQRNAVSLQFNVHTTFVGYNENINSKIDEITEKLKQNYMTCGILSYDNDNINKAILVSLKY